MTQNSAQTRVETEILEHSLDLETLVVAACPEASPNSRVPPTIIAGIVIGELISVDDTGRPLVDFPGSPSDSPLRALSTVQVSEDVAGRSIALAFEQGDPNRPILLGMIENPKDRERAEPGNPTIDGKAVEAQVDNERLVLTADREIVLRCGKASITLTRAGKVLLRGAYLSSRSSGANRIKGGSVQIN